MGTKVIPILLALILSISADQPPQKQQKESETNYGAYADIAASILDSQNAQNLGGIIGSFVQSDGGKQLGDMLAGMTQNGNVNDVLQTIGSVVSGASQKEGSDGNGDGFDASSVMMGLLGALSSVSGDKKGFDPSLIGTMLGALGSSGANVPELLGNLGGMLAGQGQAGVENLASLLPTVLDAVSSFTGEGAKKRAAEHAEHAWLMPPVLESLHLAVDHFSNSDAGKWIIASVGAEKFVKVFNDENGKFSLAKFFELLENRSFRKHWIEMVTIRIAGVVSYFANPQTQQKFLSTVQYFVNTWLKAQGFPKSTLFDPTRPAETISALINHSFKRYLHMKVQSKAYVKPAALYVQELFRVAQKRGFFGGNGIDSGELSRKLADTINLEMIEPVARVYRAYRFAKKVPSCDKYVLCVANKEWQPAEEISLPGLKTLLGRASSVGVSWFLSSHTGTPFMTLFGAVTEERDCKVRYLEACEDFHLEELRVTTEYNHNEL